jgi:sugar lactone lactonase YvrE
MNIKPVKKTFLTAISLCWAICMLVSCIKSGTKPITSTGTATGTGIVVPDTLPSFYNPTGIVIDASGNLFVADYGNNLIRKITPAGVVSTFAGSGIEGSLNGTGVAATFDEPKGVAIDAAKTLYIADSGNNLIRKITSAGLVTTLAGSDSTGMADGPGNTATFFSPSGVAVDGSGNVFVADAGNNLIRMITPAGLVSTPAGSLDGSVFYNPTGIAIDGNNNLFVANNLANNILEVSLGKVSVFAGNGQQGATDGPGSLAAFYYPNSLALDAAGNVYVADGINNTIRKITPAGVVSTLAGNGTAGNLDGTGAAASFNGPAGLAVDATGNVYVADANNNTIRKITPAGVVTTFAGSGEAGAKNGIAVSHTNTILTVSRNKHLNIWSKPLYHR